MEELKKSLARVEEKLDNVKEDLTDIKLVQVGQAADLKHHIARTDAAEARISTVEDKLLPLVELKTKVDGVFLFLGKIGFVMGLIFGAVKTIEILKGFL